MDREWLQLIMEAKNIGIKKEEIRRFLFREHEVLVEGR
ncbi:anti-repressor SinI family protein [Bacillus sp. Bva_UNVM-123]